MIPVILIVGEKASGKTSLMEKLIAELSRRGLRVGAFKHSSHHLDFDREDKDTGRFARAGAHAVAASSDSMVVFYCTTEELWDPERLRDRFFEKVDILLGEGFKQAPFPKIAVLQKGEDISKYKDHGLLAVVADARIKSELPRFSMDEIDSLADLLEKQIRLKKGKREVTLYVNGRKIKIKPFIKEFFLNTISAMVASLRDTEKASRIIITIDQAENK